MEKKRILIVDDERSVLNAIRDRFTREGFTTLEAIDGEKGLETALREHPDLILLDLIMPVMDGITMLKKLREDEWGKNAKIIILSNLTDDKKVLESVKSGVHDYLVKTDWRLEDVILKVRERLSR